MIGHKICFSFHYLLLINGMAFYYFDVLSFSAWHTEYVEIVCAKKPPKYMQYPVYHAEHISELL